MPSDLPALLAAVVTDPSDDVARLIYADCLEEHGNAPRAAFIRLQIEAEHHHPDSNTRAELEGQAQALFERHWIEWWDEVCVAVGLPRPAPKSSGILDWLAGRVGLGRTPGAPYRGADFAVKKLTWDDSGMGQWDVTFRRGFPDCVVLTHAGFRVLPAWPRISPLANLIADSCTDPNFWPEGPHLSGVRELTLADANFAVASGILASPHLGGIEGLELPTYDDYDSVPVEELEGRAAASLGSIRTRQLKRLALHVPNDRTAEMIAGCASLDGLTTLELDFRPEIEATNTMRLATLAHSPHLAGLQSLTMTGSFEKAGIEAVIQNPAWTGLRKLDLRFFWAAPFAWSPLADWDTLPELEEVRLYQQPFSAAPNIDALVRSPLLKRVRHFALFSDAEYDARALMRLTDVVDPKRIETFAISIPGFPKRAADALRAKFGDRLRILPA